MFNDSMIDKIHQNNFVSMLQICPIPFRLYNMNTYNGGQQMNLSWWDGNPNRILQTTYWATPRQQSDSNWNSSVFIYRANADCVDCLTEGVTLNFRFEVMICIDFCMNGKK